MTVKICWIHPTTKNDTLSPLWDKLKASVDPALLPSTELVSRFMTRSGNYTRSSYAEHLNSVHMLEAALQAERDGFDGVFFGCWNDALWEAREILNIPVASVGEQSMLAAMAMASKFAVITVSEKTAVAIEKDIVAYGLRERCIARPARSVQPESNGALLLESVGDAYAGFVPRFEQAAADCIHEGAEILLVGCAYYGPVLRAAGYTEVPGTGVPVLDSTTVALKYLETMVDIRRTMGLVKSTSRTFRSPPDDVILKARHALQLI